MSKPLRILLIEDNEADARLVRELIAEAGTRHFDSNGLGGATHPNLVAVGRVSAGLERLAQGDIDVILLDLSLPDSQGLATLVKVREHAPEIPIVVLTGLNDEALAVQAIQAGAQDYLIKGYSDLTAMMRVIRYAIERKRAEEALQQRNRELELLNRAGQAFNSTLDLEQVFARVLDQVRQQLRVVGTFWLIDPETGGLVCRQASGPYGQAIRHWRLQPGQGIAGWVAQQGENVIVGDATTDPRHFGGIDEQTGQAYHSILCVPLQSKQKVIGVLQVLDTKPNRFSRADVLLVESLAATAANAIENARLYDQLQRELIQRRQALEQLRQTTEELQAQEMQFRKLIVKNVDGIIVVDQTGVIRFVNPAGQALFGQTDEELVGKPLGLTMLDEEKTEIEIRRPDGNGITAELRVVEIEWHEEKANLVSLRDVTERKRVEEVLRSLALVDELTGLYNRRGFVALSQEELKLAQRMKKHMLLLFVDIDRMKWINDTLGHPEGDRALIAVANVLRETLRTSDIIARLGGDEFAVLAMQFAGKGATVVKNRLQEKLSIHNAKDNHGYRLSLSVGVADYDPENPRSIDELLAQADTLMYQEKRGKSNGR